MMGLRRMCAVSLTRSEDDFMCVRMRVHIYLFSNGIAEATCALIHTYTLHSKTNKNVFNAHERSGAADAIN